MKALPIDTLITAYGYELKTDSRKVATAFGRQPNNVLRSIGLTWKNKRLETQNAKCAVI